ncbi:hypothetical protein PHLGIDRAFT_69543 [Phlebiopsis gigantea 11061_1 CR5-6]|uniref:Eukaryotic translation initiation factor 3 subunit M n=1 Tax=Phlebiopsis gigantea (strain 11061_1 CR5-6) TaxID=745531 RepID=A0A0C3NSX7_PHLG1|nr:hypothetical protein PHLGIDRAFT_69543 [Phlebiopsis gigantea 11061_1 CR5-6]
MPAADSISIFAEGTFEDQIKELVDYLAQGHSDEERATLLQQFQDALTVQEGRKPLQEDAERTKSVLTLVLAEVKGLGEGSEKEIEGFFNLLFAHLLTSFPADAPETKEHVLKLLQIIASSDARPTTRLRMYVLSNLFNALPRRSGLRLPVNEALIRIAASSDELEQLSLTLPEVEKWLSEWDVSQEQKTTYLKTLVDTFAYEPATSYQYQLAYVKSLPAASAHDAAVDVIASALRLPLVFDFDALFRIDAIVAAKDNDIYTLLQIFLNDGLTEYNAWVSSHGDILTKHNLDGSQLERKIRLLSLTTLAFQNIDRDLPYSSIAEVLQVEPSHVERWVIDVLRTGLVVGKLSQTSQTFHIVRASARAFEREQWQALEKRLVAWKSGLASVREVIASAQKKNVETAPSAAANGVESSTQQTQATAA